MKNYKARKSAGRTFIEKDSSDRINVFFKQFDPDTGAETEPVRHRYTLETVEAAITAAAGDLDDLKDLKKDIVQALK